MSDKKSFPEVAPACPLLKHMFLEASFVFGTCGSRGATCETRAVMSESIQTRAEPLKVAEKQFEAVVRQFALCLACARKGYADLC